MRFLVVVLLLAAALVSGCGQDDQLGPDETARQFWFAVAEGDGERACSMMDPTAYLEFSNISNDLPCAETVDMISTQLNETGVNRFLAQVGAGKLAQTGDAAVFYGPVEPVTLLSHDTSEDKWVIEEVFYEFSPELRDGTSPVELLHETYRAAMLYRLQYGSFTPGRQLKLETYIDVAVLSAEVEHSVDLGPGRVFRPDILYLFSKSRDQLIVHLRSEGRAYLLDVEVGQRPRIISTRENPA